MPSEVAGNLVGQKLRDAKSLFLYLDILGCEFTVVCHLEVKIEVVPCLFEIGPPFPSGCRSYITGAPNTLTAPNCQERSYWQVGYTSN
jgi:hypothetical protein